MSLQPNGKITAIYLRLSSDDGNVGDSDSIVNQRSMLMKYAQDNGFGNITEFSDDGYSGSNFQRPSFQRMLALVENGKVGTIIVKDLSRLGREYIQMGMFTEIVFPKYNVNFIAINDFIDSRKGENDFAAFKNLFNEFFIRDTSRKVKAVKDMQAKNGQRVNGALTPFGYKYDGEKLIIDETTAPIVKRIFNLCVGGLGPTQIARKLTDEKIITPYSYKGYCSGGAVIYPNRWSETTVSKMLERKEYIEHTVNKKSYVLSYKQKKRVFNDEADTLIFYNTHEAIVDDQTFEIVQNIRKNKKRTTKMGEQPIFSGLVFCADCGKSEYIFRGTALDPSQYTYNCGNYRGKSRSCTPHGIRLVVLEKLVLEHIRMVTSYAVKHEAEFAKKLMQSSVKNKQTELSKKKRELDTAKRRIAELDSLFNRIYEDRILSNLSEERYQKMSAAYESEQKELTERVEILETDFAEQSETMFNLDKFLKVARKYTQLEALDGTILRELIEKIVIHEKVRDGGEVKAGKKVISQRIDIYYNFVGVVEMEQKH